MRHYVFDRGLTAVASPQEKLLVQKCYESCDIGKDDLGRQRVIDVCTNTLTEVHAILTMSCYTKEFDHELDRISPVFLPYDRHR